MGKFKSILKKYWITVWMVMAVMAVVTVYVSSEYINNQNRVNRVIANMGDTGRRFSSDRLNASTTITSYEVPFPTAGEAPCEIPFYIFNHSLTDTAKRYQDEIYYQISAKLTDNNGNDVEIYDNDPDTPKPSFSSDIFGIKANADDSYTFFESVNATVTKAGHFRQNEENDSHLYYICFPRSMTSAATNEKVYIELVATPYSDNAHTKRITELDILTARLSVMSQAASIDRGWSGSFQDSTQTDLDGFTFVFSGSGTSKLVLSYRSDLFEVNQFFLNEHSDDAKFTFENEVYYRNVTSTVEGETVTTWTKFTSAANWKTIIIDANSEDVEENGTVTVKGINRYDIQLYMKSSDVTNYLNEEGTALDWDKIDTYIYHNPNAPATAVSG